MDTRRIDEADPTVTFDLLGTWLSDAFDRRAVGTNSPGCAWQALTHALRYGARERSRDAWEITEAATALGASPVAAAAASAAVGASCGCAEEEVTEKELRRRIVSTYSQQQGSALDAIIEAKRADPLSYFCHAGHSDVEGARQHWIWYLYCLTFEVADFCEQSRMVDQEIVCMPLDLVDLQVVALTFRVQVTVARLMEEALRIRPPADERAGGGAAGLAAHLLQHGGLWTPLLPLLGSRPPEEDLRSLVGALVETGEIPSGRLQAGSNRCALVLGYDQDNDCYMACIDQTVFPLERRQIKQALFFEREAAAAEAAAAAQGPAPGADSRGGGEGTAAAGAKREEERSWWPGQGHPFHGITDRSLEFHVLHELVRRDARVRLEKTMQDLAGRTAPTHAVSSSASSALKSGSGGGAGGRAASTRPEPVPTLARARHEAARQPQQHAASVAKAPAPAPAVPPSILKRIPLEEASVHMAAGQVISVVSPCTWEPHGEDQLRIVTGEEVQLQRFQDTWVWASVTAPSHHAGAEGWCPRDCLLIWEVHKSFTPDLSWNDREMYLPLKAGDCVIVTFRNTGDWAGWVFGLHWGEEENASEGLFPLLHVRPRMLLSRLPGT